MKPRLRRLAWWSHFQLARAFWPTHRINRLHLLVAAEVARDLLTRSGGPWFVGDLALTAFGHDLPPG